ncbi:MAG: EamA family transporter RarD [Woeseiaceae bacterium]
MINPEPDVAPVSPERQWREGILSALIAYLVWGFLPVYFILVKTVPALELLAHRVIWAVPFGALIIHLRRQWPEVRWAFTHPVTMVYMVATSILIAGNWLVYIWAVQQDQIFQASLGYYINPLLFAVAGVFLLGEHLRRQQVLAVWLAAIGVVVLTVSGGTLPAIALFLGSSFTVYGIIRKKAAIRAMPGLFIETILLLPVAVVYLLILMSRDQAVFGTGGAATTSILLLAGPLTVIPLLFFALAAKRLPLATLGMMQFLAPTLQFLVGVYYGEQLTTAHIICFACIWGAVLLFSVDAVQANRKLAKSRP